MSYYVMTGAHGVLMITDAGVLQENVTTEFDADGFLKFADMWHEWASLPYDAPERYDETLAAEVVRRCNLGGQKNGGWKDPRHIVEHFVGARSWSKGGEPHFACGSVRTDYLDTAVADLTHRIENYEARLDDIGDWRDLLRTDFTGAYRYEKDLHACAFKHRAMLQERIEKVRAGHLWKPAVYSDGKKVRDGDGSTEYLLTRAVLIPDD